MAITLVLPAHAGMIPCEAPHKVAAKGAPRACGDDPLDESGNLEVGLCSPRMRG